MWVCRTRGPSAAATAISEVGASVCGAGGMFGGGWYVVGLAGGDAGGYSSYYQIQISISSYYGKEI